MTTGSEEIYDMSAGFRLALDLRDPLQRWIAGQREYEPEVSWIYPHLLTTGDVAIDGGAHVGYLSLLMARCVGPQGRVHAFEPIASTFQSLERNVALNPWAQISAQPVALGDRRGVVRLEIPIDPQGTSPLAWGATAVHLRRGQSQEAQVIPLDAYVADQGIRHIKLLKLDLEGAELAAIDGAEQLLREGRVTYLICELNQFLLDAQGLRYDELRSRLARHGYRAYRLGKDGRLHVSDTPILRPHLITSDLLFAPGPL